MDQVLYNIIILVLQGITIIVTAITLIANLNSTKKENAKKRMVEITIKHRLEEMKEIKTLSAKYLTYLHPDIVLATKNSELSLELLSLHNNIASLLKTKYEQDQTLLKEMNLAYSIAMKYNSTKDDAICEELKDQVAKLYSLFSLYSYANWVCIKEQAYGDELKSVDYRKVYEENYPFFVKE